MCTAKIVVKVFGMMNASPDFDQHPNVINRYVDFMLLILGEKKVSMHALLLA
jgi:hypothetical protein